MKVALIIGVVVVVVLLGARSISRDGPVIALVGLGVVGLFALQARKLIREDWASGWRRTAFVLCIPAVPLGIYTLVGAGDQMKSGGWTIPVGFLAVVGCALYALVKSFRPPSGYSPEAGAPSLKFQNMVAAVGIGQQQAEQSRVHALREKVYQAHIDESRLAKENAALRAENEALGKRVKQLEWDIDGILNDPSYEETRHPLYKPR